jgi:PAS domain S-box-containing protein
VKKRPSPAESAGELRRQAELQLRRQPAAAAAAAAAAADPQRLLQELQIHQIELEMQNEELKHSKAEVEASLEKYADLYEFSPVGNFTLAPDGTIQLVNLTGTSLVGIARSRLVGRPFGLLVSDKFRPAFGTFLKQAFATEAKLSGDFELAGPGPMARTVSIEVQRMPDGLGCRAAVSDITTRKRAADLLRVLWTAADMLLFTDEPDRMVHNLFARIGPALGVDAYFNYMVDDTGGALRLVSHSGLPEPTAGPIKRLGFGQAISGTVAQSRQPIHETGIQQSHDPRVRLAKSFGFRSFVSNPLIAVNRLIGTLSCGSRAREQFEPDELIALQTISHYVALAYERARDADAIQVSEIRYRRLFEAAQDGVLLLDPGTRKITDANPFMTKLLGYSNEELVGKELFEIGLLKDEAASRAMFQKLKSSRQVRYDNLPLLSAGGRHQEVEVVANLYGENGQPVIQCNIRDITARKRVEDLLRRNEALFSTLIQQAPVGIFVVDAGFRLQQLNSTALPVFKNIRPLIGRDFGEIYRILWPKRVAGRIVKLFRHTLKTGEPYQSPEFTERRRDTGVLEIYEWQIQRVTLPAGEYGVVAFFNNITERKQAERAQHLLDVMTASNHKLKVEIIQRQVLERNLKESEQGAHRLLKQSHELQARLRTISHQILVVQENERKRISRELHDDICQLLVGVDVHLAGFAKSAAINPRGIPRTLGPLRQLMADAVHTVHRFARDLRPAMLDDLGLIPALGYYIKHFPKRRGWRIQFTAFAGVEALDNDKRTVLYRIAQEALANVAKHASCSVVKVAIRKVRGGACLEVTDNGKGFKAGAHGSGKLNTRLGLIGMRERVEMVGGRFSVASVPGKGTTVRAEIPFAAVALNA